MLNDSDNVFTEENGVIGAGVVKYLSRITVNQGGRGQWAVYYTSPQSFIIMFSYLFA